MRIAIDARMISKRSMHGIARYVYQLLDCLIAIGKNHQFFIFMHKNSPLAGKKWPQHIQPIFVKARWISFREQWELPVLLKKIKADLFHAPSFVAPIYCPCRLVMTIHDLNHLVLPQFYTPIHQLYYQAFVQKCIRNSEYILTVSHFSKHEIMKTLNISQHKVLVTYNGVTNDYVKVSDPDKLQYVRELYELPPRFIFCLTNNKPHKNIHQLVRAYCFSNINIPLVLACAADKLLIRIAEKYNKKHLLYFSTFVREEHLPTVYSLSHIFVYPSTYEGFGLPPLEAMSCGTPVVVANSSSLPEVVGGNASFVDPYDYQDIAVTLEEALNNREKMAKQINDGMQYAKKFTWLSMAEKTLDVYENCLPIRKDLTLGGQLSAHRN